MKFGRRNGTEPAASAQPTDLARRRDELAYAFWEAQSDLGGLVYEMVRRDQFRMELIVRQTAHLQELHTQLAESERLLALEQAGASGACANCGALHAEGAAYCSQCGHALSGPTQLQEGAVTS